jgi:hypothetical protein
LSPKCATPRVEIELVIKSQTPGVAKETDAAESVAVSSIEHLSEW